MIFIRINAVLFLRIPIQRIEKRSAKVADTELNRDRRGTFCKLYILVTYFIVTIESISK